MQASPQASRHDGPPVRAAKSSSIETRPALRWLRALLVFDAFTCLALGAVLLAANAAAARLTGLPPILLMEAGAMLLAFGFFVGWAALRRVASRLAVLCIVDANVAWAVASLALVMAFAEHATPIGRWLVSAQGIAVGGLAVLEFLAWRRTIARN